MCLDMRSRAPQGNRLVTIRARPDAASLAGGRVPPLAHPAPRPDKGEVGCGFRQPAWLHVRASLPGQIAAPGAGYFGRIPKHARFDRSPGRALAGRAGGASDSRGLRGSNQPLDKVRLRPEDGCYWYEYQGPVETLMVPLRAVGGGKICQALAAPLS